jgi:membrane protein
VAKPLARSEIMATETKEPQDEQAQGEKTQKRTSTGALVTVEKAAKPLQAFLNKFNNDWTMNIAAGLAYNLLMSIFPIIIALLGILGLIIGALDRAAFDSLINNLGNALHALPGVKETIRASLTLLSKSALVLEILAIVLSVFNGSRLFVYLEGCFDIIYHVRPRGFLQQNIMAIGMLLLFIVLIPIMVLASTAPAVVLSILNIPGASFLVSLTTIIGSLFVAWILFVAIYMVVPNQKISLRNSWLGALVAAILLQLFLILFPFYVAHFLSSGPIAQAGAFIILLVFFYYFAVILFLGAEVNAYFSEGIRATPYDLPTLVHMITSHLLTSEKDVREQAAATHKQEPPKVILPKNEASEAMEKSVRQDGSLVQAVASADSAARPTSASIPAQVETQSKRADKDDGSDDHKAQKKAKAGSARAVTIIEAVVGTALAFGVELVRLRRKK